MYHTAWRKRTVSCLRIGGMMKGNHRQHTHVQEREANSRFRSRFLTGGGGRIFSSRASPPETRRYFFLNHRSLPGSSALVVSLSGRPTIEHPNDTYQERPWCVGLKQLPPLNLKLMRRTCCLRCAAPYNQETKERWKQNTFRGTPGFRNPVASQSTYIRH